MFSELVTGKAQDLEGIVGVHLCQCIQREVLLGEASEGGQVHHQGHLVPVLLIGEGDRLGLLDVLDGEVLETLVLMVRMEALGVLLSRKGTGHLLVFSRLENSSEWCWCLTPT